MKKELLRIEFRYHDTPKHPDFSGFTSKTITIGIYDTLNEAIEAGNEAVKELAKSFEVREDDKFQLKFLFGCPKKLVSNTCYPTKGISYFAKIETLDFSDLSSTIAETFEAYERYSSYKLSENEE